MRWLLIFAIFLAGCRTSSVVDQTTDLTGTWNIAEAIEGHTENAPSQIFFTEDNKVVIDNESMRFRAHPPYLIVWEDETPELPTAVYFVLEEGQLRIWTDVGTFGYRRAHAQ